MEEVIFGKYPQGPNGEARPIEGYILDSTQTEDLLISKYGLDVKSFSEGSNIAYGADCSLHNGLNVDFYQDAFNESERNKIVRKLVVAHSDDIVSTCQGDDTEDLVFLLSTQEVADYIHEKRYLVCFPTPFAEKKGAAIFDTTKIIGFNGDAKGCIDGAGNGWLRTKGGKLHPYYEREAVYKLVGKPIDFADEKPKNDIIPDSNYAASVTWSGNISRTYKIDKGDLLIRPCIGKQR